MARQRLGQHFLGNLAWRNRILKSLPRGAGETWIEIGAGHGEMTQLLAQDGRRVIAIETDQLLIDGLKANAAKWGNVEIIEGDVLRLDLEKIAGGDFRVYGNLPYYITSPILFRLFTYADQIASIDIVIQFEVAERIAAAPGCRDFGYLSAACQFYTKPQIAFRIPPGAFRPPPRVTSALLHMELPGERTSLKIENEKRFLEFIGTCFGQKRKTLRNNLLEIMPDEQIQAALADTGLRSDARAEQLSLAQFAKLFAWTL